MITIAFGNSKNTHATFSLFQSLCIYYSFLSPATWHSWPWVSCRSQLKCHPFWKQFSLLLCITEWQYHLHSTFILYIYLSHLLYYFLFPTLKYNSSMSSVHLSCSLYYPEWEALSLVYIMLNKWEKNEEMLHVSLVLHNICYIIKYMSFIYKRRSAVKKETI